MSKFQRQKWFWTRRGQLYWGSREMQSSFSKFKGSILAVILGLIIGSLVIAGTGNNAFTYFHYLLFFAFSSYGYNNWDNTLVWWAIYIVAGLALVMSFKTGMFNIGVSGQMLAAGTVILTIGIKYDLSQPVAIVVALLAGVLAATLVAVVTALLKVFFNVHEVVSSILLNWTIWYLIKWYFTTSNDLYNSSSGATAPVHSGMSFEIAGYKFILPLIIAFSLVLLVWFLLKKTTLGYKVKTVGLNPFAANYSGISIRRYGFTSFVISGALAGVMGVLFYVGMNPSLSFASDTLPPIGFDSISVALVGQINAFGTVAAAFLWGLIKSGGPVGSVGLGIPNAVSDVIFGVIIYSAACAVLLARFAPIKSIIGYFNIIFHTPKRKKFHHYLGNMWNSWMKTFQIKRDYRIRIKDCRRAGGTKVQKEAQVQALVSDQKEDIQVCYSHIAQERQAMKNYFVSEYHKIWTTGKRGLKYQVQQAKRQLYGQNLNQYINDRTSYENSVHSLNQNFKTKKIIIKKQDGVTEAKRLNDLRIAHQKQLEEHKNNFNQKFSQLLNDEQERLKKIPLQVKETHQAKTLERIEG